MSDASRPVGRRIDAEELLAHAAWLRALARSLVRDEHAADDLVQETFVAAVERPPREPRALRGWLAAVARHAASNARRGRRRRDAREAAASTRTSEPATVEVVERIEMQRALLDTVEALEEPYRTVVLLRFYDGKTPREIARELDVAPAVVWQRLSRATAMLRARLDRRPGGRDEWKGALLLWVGGRDAATWGGAGTAAVGTGGAIMGTKTVVTAVAVVALGAWWLVPRDPVDRHGAAPPKSPETASAVATASRLAPPTRAVRSDDAAAAIEATSASPPTPRARTHGRVVDADSGDPIAGAKVSITRKSAGGGFKWSLVTGADGAFVGEVEESAEYRKGTSWSAVKSDLFVEASARGYVWFFEGPWSGSRGEDLGVVKLHRGVVVRGRVVRADGTPVPGASVYATAGPARVGTDQPLNRARALGKADAAGRFELDEALHATGPDEAFTLLAACDEGVAFTTLVIRKGRDAVDDVVLTLHVGATTVRVLDPDGRPLAGAEVTALPQFRALAGTLSSDRTVYSIAGDDALRGHFVATTGTDGTVSLQGLPIADDASTSGYAVAAAAPGFITGWAETSVGTSPRAPVEIRLVREYALVAGARVVDADDRPIEGATVTVLRGTTAPLKTGADGVFVLARMKGEPKGTFATVEVTKDGYAKRNAPVYRIVDGGFPLPTIRLERPAPVEGVVLDQDGKPVAGAFVTLWRNDAWLRLPGDMKTPIDGRFAFPEATAGEWALRVAPPADGGAWSRPDDVLVLAGRRDVVARLARFPAGRATVVVTLVDAESGESANADAVLLFLARNEDMLHRNSPPQPRIDGGKITATAVPPGDYALWVRVEGRPYQLVRIRVAEDATEVRSTLRVRRAVAVSGTVRMPAGVSAQGMSLTFTPAGDPPVPGGPGGWELPKWRWPQTVAVDGTFRVEGLTPSIYRIEARGAGWLGDVIVDASEVDATTVVAVARAGIVKISVPATSVATSAQVVGSLNDGPWISIVNMGMYPDHAFSTTQTMSAGRLRWRAVFRRTPSPSDPFDLAEPQQGEVNVEEGKEVEIVLSVAPRK